MNLNDFGLTKQELAILKKLNTPGKIQDFLNKIPMNFEENGDSCMSPRKVLRENKCHCIEGAMLAAVCLRINNLDKPLVVDLTANDKDFDHVIAVFKKDKKWGAISKTNHSVLRYREPVYNSIRELVMSYFHEYTNSKGKRTLRSYSNPVDLSRFDYMDWQTSESNLWEIPEYLAEVEHFAILNRKQIANLRGSDDIELEAGKIVEWKSDRMKENL